MATPNKWAIQQVYDVKLFSLDDGSSYGALYNLKETTLNQEGTIVYAQGGKGNPKIIGFDHSKMATLTGSSAIFHNGILALQNGTTPVTGTNTDYVYTDVITVVGNAAIATYTPLGTAGSEVKFAYEKNTDGTQGTSYEQDSVVSAGKFTVSGQNLTFNAGDIADGTEIIIYYNCTAGSSTKTISSYTDVFAKHCKVVADTLVRDVCTKEDYAAQLIIYNAKLSNNYSFTLTADGEPSIQNFELEALKQCSSTKLYDIIILDSSETT